MQHKHRVSLVVTVRNEQHTVRALIKSILQQTKLPDEVIFIDGKSTDNTSQLLTVSQGAFDKKKVALVLIQQKGNRAKGRNVGIKKARSPIICVTDAGCILERNWLERITKPLLDNEADVVAGFYRPTGNTIFQKCYALYTSVFDDQLNPRTFLPSSRSIAFRKQAWKKVCGYPEELDTCEDLVFARKLKNDVADFAFVNNAIVYWEQEKNLLSAFLQLYGYAKGDGQALYIRPTTPFVFLRYAVALFLLIVIVLTQSIPLVILFFFFLGVYVLFAVVKHVRYVGSFRAIFYLPLLQFTADIAVIAGMAKGILVRFTS